MDERRYLDLISGERTGLPADLMRAGLSLLAPLYRAAVCDRNRLYDVGLKRSQQVVVPVVSVGNITTGGTGKTPVVAWLADWLSSQGRQPCFISRGYRALDETGNDEFRVLQQLCPDVPHLQNRDRVKAAREAISRHAPDVLILDDGFQHRRLSRDLDVVLVDALNPWGYDRLLPRGLLREPKSSLARADVVVVTRADQVEETARSQLLDDIAALTPAPVAQIAFRPQRLMAIDGKFAELASLSGQKLSAFCGIGNPDAFGRTLMDAGFENVPIEAFPDHHHYSRDDLRRLHSLAVEQQASALVTTQKDLVKLDPAWVGEMPVWGVVIGVELTAGREELQQMLTSLFAETEGHRRE